MSVIQSTVEAKPTHAGSSVVLFDGVCNFCNGTINFAIDRDPKRHLRFASLQSDLGRRLLTGHNLPVDALDTIVLIESGRSFVKSSAALRIARRLKFPWCLASAGLIVPRPLRDFVYDWVAKNRYRWFGKSESCRIPSAALQERFLA